MRIRFTCVNDSESSARCRFRPHRYNSALFEATLSLNGLSRDFLLLLEILAEELQHPAFNPEELVKVKAELKTSILRNVDNTSLRDACLDPAPRTFRE